MQITLSDWNKTWQKGRVKNMKIGFIGAGNMAGAMIGGIVQNGITRAEDIYVSASSPASAHLTALEERYGITAAASNAEVAREADVLFLAVKPNKYEEVIWEIASQRNKDGVFVSMTPGKTMEWLLLKLGEGAKIVRTMPNTPALVGEGMTGYCCNENVTEEDKEKVRSILCAFGKGEEITENLIDAVVAVSGSSPAYVFMMIEALADGAVAEGMPRGKAYQFAAQAVLGSAKMVLETGKHPGELKDMVCSPGGTTILAVKTLEERGFRAAVEEAMRVCAEKSRSI